MIIEQPGDPEQLLPAREHVLALRWIRVTEGHIGEAKLGSHLNAAGFDRFWGARLGRLHCLCADSAWKSRKLLRPGRRA